MSGRDTTNQRRLALESLETRQLMAADARIQWIADVSTLVVDGTGKADTIVMDANKAGKITVKVNSKQIGTFEPAAATRVLVTGNGGNDKITIGKKVALEAVIRGGDGNDTITGGGGRATLYGGAGNDTLKSGSRTTLLDGGLGNDKLMGGGAKDLLLGGDGNDTLDGGSGEDLLFGGIGNDSLNGKAGKDMLFGGEGTNKLSGKSSEDYLGKGVVNLFDEAIQSWKPLDRLDAIVNDLSSLVDRVTTQPWYGNYLGPNNNGLDTAPINSLDNAARMHDIAYDFSGAQGIAGAVTNRVVSGDDWALAVNAANSFWNDGNLGWIDRALAAGTAGVFGALGYGKELANSVFGEPASPFRTRLSMDVSLPSANSIGSSASPYGSGAYSNYSSTNDSWQSSVDLLFSNYGLSGFGSSGYSPSLSSDFFGGGYDASGYGGGNGGYDLSGMSGYTPPVTTVGGYDSSYASADNWSSAFWGDDTFGSLGSFASGSDPWSSAFTSSFFDNLGFNSYASADPYGSYLSSSGDYNYYGGGQRLGVLDPSSLYMGYSSYDDAAYSSSVAYGDYGSYGSSYDTSYWLKQLDAAQNAYNQRYDSDDYGGYSGYGPTPTFNNSLGYGEQFVGQVLRSY